MERGRRNNSTIKGNQINKPFITLIDKNTNIESNINVQESVPGKNLKKQKGGYNIKSQKSPTTNDWLNRMQHSFSQIHESKVMILTIQNPSQYSKEVLPVSVPSWFSCLLLKTGLYFQFFFFFMYFFLLLKNFPQSILLIYYQFSSLFIHYLSTLFSFTASLKSSFIIFMVCPTCPFSSCFNLVYF